MTPHDFLSTLYSNVSTGWLTVWTLPDKKTAFFPVADIPAALRYHYGPVCALAGLVFRIIHDQSAYGRDSVPGVAGEGGVKIGQQPHAQFE